MLNTKIVCTLGPSSDGVEELRGLVDAGMSVARLNASHGSVDHRETVIERVREVAETTGKPVATMLDLSGPEIRTTPLDAPVHLEAGSEVRFIKGDTADRRTIGLSSSIAAVDPGDAVLLDDARIETTVEHVEDGVVFATVDAGGELGGRKGVNVPGVDLDLDVVTESDRAELRLAAEAEVDYVAASFVGDADDVYAIDEVLESFGGDAPVIAKIERAEAVENLDDILDAADGVMVARGDLGVECPLEEVPIIQKRIIRKAREVGLPVITATEMLDSMVHSARPTRAEASDVANAVLDGTDAVMLSGETAIGDHPVTVVETMVDIVEDVERSDEYTESREKRIPAAADTRTDALARSARYLARDVGATAIVAATESGYTARKVAKYRPAVPVVAVTADRRVRRQLALYAGIEPHYRPFSQDDGAALIETAAATALETGVAASGDTVVVLSGMMTELEGANTTNTLKVHLAAEVLASGRGIAPGRTFGPVCHAPDGDVRDCPDGSVVVVDDDIDEELTDNLDAIAGIVSAAPDTTSYTATVARELGVPMVGDATLTVGDGEVVTVDGERGVVYASEVAER
jgi:pyruvate kinase